MTVTLITGGARSGKSIHAERIALSGGARPFYLATAQVDDVEMTERVMIHRTRRGDDWHEVGVDLDLVGALRSCTGGGVRLVDCLSLWLSNLMFRGCDSYAAGDVLVEYLAQTTAQVVFVTNEVGLGIVPDNVLARDFRDRLGVLNQRVASVATRVDLVIAGQPLRIK